MGLSGWASRAQLVLVCAFMATTLAFLTVLVVMIVVQPRFPLNLGVVATTGRSGLLVLVPPAVAVAAGLLLLKPRRRTGAILLGVYSIFWAFVFLSGLPRVWNARQAFCLNALGFCIYSPWVARATVFGIVTPFLLTAWWSARQALTATATRAGRP